MSQLTPTFEEADVYARCYIQYQDQTRAFIKTFPDSQAKLDTIYTKASQFHKTEQVQSRIQELRAMSRKVADDEFNLTTEQLLRVLARVMQEGFNGKKNLNAVVSAVKEVNLMNGNHATSKIDLGTNLLEALREASNKKGKN